MIKAYLAGISTQYEGEDIEVRYCIYEDEEFLCKESVMMGYKKPAIVGQVALTRLLKELVKYRNQEIVIIVNDAALNEIVRETSTTQNKDVLNMAKKTKAELSKFENLDIKDISGNRTELLEWDEILQW